MELTIARLVITARLRRDFGDPWALFRCREGFQEAFRLVSRCGEGGMELGMGDGDCPHCLVFSQSLSSDPEAVKRHQKPPLPFAFQFPVLPPAPNRGESFEVGLTLVGSATRYAAEFVAALATYLSTEEGSSPIAAVEQVEAIGYFGERTPWAGWHGKEQGAEMPVLLTAGGLSDTRLLGERIGLSIVTPLKIMQEGRPLRTFSFSPFFRTLMRRVSALASSYGDGEMAADFVWLARLSGAVSMSDSTFRWVEWSKTGGLMGDAVLSGGLEELMPFLLLGECLNVGKGAPFGLGRFVIRSLSA